MHSSKSEPDSKLSTTARRNRLAAGAMKRAWFTREGASVAMRTLQQVLSYPATRGDRHRRVVRASDDSLWNKLAALRKQRSRSGARQVLRADGPTWPSSLGGPLLKQRPPGQKGDMMKVIPHDADPAERVIRLKLEATSGDRCAIRVVGDGGSLGCCLGWIGPNGFTRATAVSGSYGFPLSDRGRIALDE